jgi:hypothetical protein
MLRRIALIRAAVEQLKANLKPAFQSFHRFGTDDRSDRDHDGQKHIF